MSAEHRPGDVIDDRYELLFEMRSGGMGAVWRARDLLEEQEVAVKEIRFPAILDQPARQALTEKLVAEARILSRLDHPGLVEVVDVLEAHDPPLIVTEVVDGPTLADLVEESGEPLPPERVAVIGLAVVEALLACASEGLHHRFLRPSRVLLPYDGPVRVADFGVSALIGDPEVTATGSVGDAVAFLPPEHRSEPAGSAAADMWALGATLYAACEGAPPFAAGSAKATLDAIADDPPRPMQRAGGLEPVITDLLAKDPQQRPDHYRVRQLLRSVALVPVGAPGGPLTPVEALERMFHRDPDTPQLHLLPPDPGEEPAPGDGANGDGVDGGTPPPVPPRPAYSPAERRRRRGWTIVAALSLVGITGSLYAVGGRKAVERQQEVRQAETWVAFTHEEGDYTISYPASWSVAQDGSLTDFTDPVTGAAVRVGYQEPPQNTPAGLWLDLEKGFQAEQPSYRRVRLNQSVHDGYPAAVWEFTWTHNGTPVHNYDLAFNVGSHSYALNFQAREADWLQMQDTFDRFVESFEPPA